jgi:hypothetical protein
VTAEGIVTVGSGIAGTIRFTTGLDPDESINVGVASAASRTDTETGTLDVAPITPLWAETSDTAAASINDSLGGHTGALEGGTEVLDVELLVLALVPLSIRELGKLAGALVERVVAGNVGRNTTELLRRASSLVDRGELFGTRG